MKYFGPKFDRMDAYTPLFVHNGHCEGWCVDKNHVRLALNIMLDYIRFHDGSITGGEVCIETTIAKVPIVRRENIAVLRSL